MVRHRGAVRLAKAALVWVLALVLSTVLFSSCVHYVPREEQSNDTTAENCTEPATDTTATEEPTEDPTDTSFPNEPDDGHTKRY